MYTIKIDLKIKVSGPKYQIFEVYKVNSELEPFIQVRGICAQKSFYNWSDWTRWVLPI